MFSEIQVPYFNLYHLTHISLHISSNSPNANFKHIYIKEDMLNGKYYYFVIFIWAGSPPISNINIEKDYTSRKNMNRNITTL